MQKTLFAATLVAGLGLSGAAVAADVYATGGGMKDAPLYGPATNWTGFYIGVGGGGGAVNHDLKASAGPFGGELNGLGGDGGFGTVEVGYDRQFGHFVAGIFFNYDFASIGTKLSIGAPIGLNASYDLNNLWSAGGRLGYLVNPNTLAYVSAAYTQASFGASSVLKEIGVGDKDYSGVSVGGGLETALGGNWFLKAEYRFTSLDSDTVFQIDGIRVTNEPDVHEGRAVLSYKFDFCCHDYAPLK